MKTAFYDQHYRNVFCEMGLDETVIRKRLEDIFNTLFYGTEEERIYHPVGDMGYIEDTGNHDVRTEGMSYGMMMCVQLDRKAEFDRLWKWAITYMKMESGTHAGYFAWSCRTDGTPNAQGPAPDGEEFFAMALFFAANRWGNGVGIYDYATQARNILHACLHNGDPERTVKGYSMWDPDNYLIRFIAECDWTDPSYHLPHFYELFALWADEADRDFWQKAAQASREYLQLSCHPVTGLTPEYAEYDGSPWIRENEQRDYGRHDWFYSDAYRTAANIALDDAWFGKTDWEKEECEKITSFFRKQEDESGVFLTDGTRLTEKALHPTGLLATIAQAGLAITGKEAFFYVQKLWDTPLRTGDRRYYDNCLYMFAFLSLSGNYRIWE